MTDAELLSLGLGSAAALVAAVLVIVGLGVMLQFDRLIGRWVALAVVPLMGLGMAASSLLSGRDLRLVFYNLQGLNVGASEGASNALRVLTLVLVGTCAATVVVRLFAKPGAGPRPPGLSLLLAFLLYFGCAGWLNALFGTVPAFSHHSLYVPVAFAAVFVWRQQPIQPLLVVAKWTLIGIMLLSLLAAVLLPKLALQPDYKGWIPGLRVRLWGVGSNPNSIGPLGLVLILLELMVPSRRWSLRLLAFSLGAAVLLLAQSKTAWAAALLVLPVLLWYRVGRAPNGGMRIGFALAWIAAGLLALLVLAWLDPSRVWDKLAGGQVGSDVATLSGRWQIWHAALRAWQDNPAFGYGPSAWGPAHRAALGLPYAFSAHNQFMQSLSAAGALGLLTLLLYLGLLLGCCWRAAEATRGLSMAFWLMVMVRCLTEAPFSSVTLFNGDMLTQVLLFRIALIDTHPFGAKPFSVPVGGHIAPQGVWAR